MDTDVYRFLISLFKLMLHGAYISQSSYHFHTGVYLFFHIWHCFETDIYIFLMASSEQHPYFLAIRYYHGTLRLSSCQILLELPTVYYQRSPLLLRQTSPSFVVMVNMLKCMSLVRLS